MREGAFGRGPAGCSMRDDSARVAVIGAGPAGLMAAEVAARGGAHVTAYDRMPTPGRKLLLAGRGGLNLTHSEPEERFRARYGTASSSLAPALDRFGPAALRRWCEELGVATFVGSSGRVFPASFKTSPLLRAWLRRLAEAGVRFVPRHHWRGWDAAGGLAFETPDGPCSVAADAAILALGGASWPQLGSDGGWTATLTAAGHDVAALLPSNCGFRVAWSEIFRDRFEGEPLKSIALSFGGDHARGDAVITRDGLEGGVVYALAAPLREALAAARDVTAHVALRPDLPHAALLARLGKRQRKQSVATALRKALGLSPVAIGLLQEAAHTAGRPLSGLDGEALATLVNAVPVHLVAPMPIARAISTAGGVRFADLDERLMLRTRPGTFVAGEMLDWEAPTGGYLLQACFATGGAAGQGALDWLAVRRPARSGANEAGSL